MRLQSLLVVALALVFGGSAAVGVRSFVNSRGEPAPKVETVPVVVALMDIARGEMLTSELIKMREFPKAMVPAGTLSKPEDAIGRVVAISLVKDETVLDAKLTPKGAGRGLEVFVPLGMRAVTIQTPSVASGLAGLILPGNRVDVLLTVNDSGGTDTGGGSTTTLLQRVEVLAVDQRIDAPADNKGDGKEMRSVTLLVTPFQANLVDLGQNRGTLHLALRNQKDEQNSNAPAATVNDLRFRREPPWDEKAKGFLGALGEALTQARLATPAPVPTPIPPPAPAPAPVVATPPPAPPRARYLTIIRGLSDPTSVRLDQNSNGEPKAQVVTNSNQTGAREVPPPATRATPGPDTRSGVTP